MRGKLLNNFSKLLAISVFLCSTNLPAKSSSALAAWALRSDGMLEIRTKANSRLKAFFQKSNNSFGDRFWIDFSGELSNPRVIKGNGPIKEIRLGKPSKNKTRLVIEFEPNNKLNPLSWELIGVDKNNWRIKLASFPKKTFKTISEGEVYKIRNNKAIKNKSLSIQSSKRELIRLPYIIPNKYYVVIDPGHGGPDPGAIGIGGLRETDVVLEVSKIVSKLLTQKGVKVKMTRLKELDVTLPRRVAIANKTNADVFISIHANASRGKRRSINGLETFYYAGWRGKLLAENVQKQILKVSPGSPDRGVRQGRFFVIKNTDMPAALVEIGFLTGRLDSRRLEKQIYRKRMAYAIAKGILQYLSKAG